MSEHQHPREENEINETTGPGSEMLKVLAQKKEKQDQKANEEAPPSRRSSPEGAQDSRPNSMGVSAFHKTSMDHFFASFIERVRGRDA